MMVNWILIEDRGRIVIVARIRPRKLISAPIVYLLLPAGRNVSYPFSDVIVIDKGIVKEKHRIN